jgi:hypothetical protein
MEERQRTLIRCKVSLNWYIKKKWRRIYIPMNFICSSNEVNYIFLQFYGVKSTGHFISEVVLWLN